MLRSGNLWGREIKSTCLEVKFPLARWQFCVNLTDSALPMRILPGDLMPPKGINIDYGKCRIFFPGDFDLQGIAAIVDQVVRIKKVLPAPAPSLPVKSSHHKDPVDGIMACGCRRPRPGHVRMDHGQEEVRIFRIPTFCFKIHHLLNFFCNRCAQAKSPFILLWLSASGGSRQSLHPPSTKLRPMTINRIQRLMCDFQKPCVHCNDDRAE